MTTDFNNLISGINLSDVLAEPTLVRSDSAVNDSFDFDEADFEPQQVVDPEQTVIPQEPYNAKEEATKLVNLLNAANSLVVTPIAVWKMRKNIGGKRILDRMQLVRIKQNKRIKLTEEEESDLRRFEVYKSDMALLNDEIPFTKEQMETLILCAIPYCESRKMKVNADLAFWGVYGGMQVQKIVKILQA